VPGSRQGGKQGMQTALPMSRRGVVGGDRPGPLGGAIEKRRAHLSNAGKKPMQTAFEGQHAEGGRTGT